MAIAAAPLIKEKRICRITLRLGDTLRKKIEHSASIAGTSISDYVIHLAAMENIVQEEAGQTLSDKEIPKLRSALNLVEAETEQLTALQKLFVIARLTRVQQMVLAGGRRRSA